MARDVTSVLDRFSAVAREAGYLLECAADWPRVNDRAPEQRAARRLSLEDVIREFERYELDPPAQYCEIISYFNGVGLRHPGVPCSQLLFEMEFSSVDRALYCQQFASKHKEFSDAWYRYKRTLYVLCVDYSLDALVLDLGKNYTGALHFTSKDSPTWFEYWNCAFPDVLSLFECVTAAIEQGIDVSNNDEPPLEDELAFAKIALERTNFPVWRGRVGALEGMLADTTASPNT